MEHFFSATPPEIIEHCILPYCPMAWLNVAKRWNQIAINNIVNDPKALANANELLKDAILAQNYKLASVLIQDLRYTAPHALSTAVSAAYEDKKANMILLRNPKGLQIERIFSRAIKLNWIDVIQEIITRNLFEFTITFNEGLYRTITAEALEIFIDDPKLEYLDEMKFTLANSNIDKRVSLICLRAYNIDLNAIVDNFGSDRRLLDPILKLSKLYEPENRSALWKAVGYCDDSIIELVKEIKTKYNLDPSSESNKGLLTVIKNSSSQSLNIIKLFLDDERVNIALEPHNINPLVLALVAAKRHAIPILLKHPKINVNWMDNILQYLYDNSHIYGLEIIHRRYKDLVTNKELLDLIPARIEHIKEHDDGYSYFYEPDYWSDDENTSESF